MHIRRMADKYLGFMNKSMMAIAVGDKYKRGKEDGVINPDARG